VNSLTTAERLGKNSTFLARAFAMHASVVRHAMCFALGELLSGRFPREHGRIMITTAERETLYLQNSVSNRGGRFVRRKPDDGCGMALWSNVVMAAGRNLRTNAFWICSFRDYVWLSRCWPQPDCDGWRDTAGSKLARLCSRCAGTHIWGGRVPSSSRRTDRGWQPHYAAVK